MSAQRKSMMESREAKRLLKAVREVLFRDWDPIPGSPSDEYDSYAPAVVRLLIADADERRIADHLRNVAGPTLAVPEEQLAVVVANLAALKASAAGFTN